jgi:putative peptidoglycan lipid II flippase
MIIALLFFGQGESDKAVYVAWSVFIGGVLQLVLIMYSSKRQQMMPMPHAGKVDGDVKQFFKNLLPAVLGSGVSQINIWIGVIIASAIPGAVSIIYFTERLVQLPISLIGVSIGIVILPSLSKHFKMKNNAHAHHIQNRALEFALLLSIPCAIGLIIMAQPIIYILFQHGEFTSSDTAKTVPALITLALGVPAFVINKVLINTFFANGDTKTPVKISSICIAINTIGNLILINFMHEAGITLSTSITAWLNIALLWDKASKKDFFKVDQTFKFKITRILLACVALGVFLVISNVLLHSFLSSPKLLHACLALSFIMCGSLVVYLGSIHLTRAFSLQDLKSLR